MGMRTKLAAALSLPPAVLGGIETVIFERESLMVGGCRKILKYTETEVYLLLVGMELRLYGTRLTLARYKLGQVTVRGVLDRVEFRSTR